MRVNGGSYTSSGTGSPAVYCTADIEVNDAKLTAERQICPLMPNPHGSSKKTAGYQDSQIKERSKMQMVRL